VQIEKIGKAVCRNKGHKIIPILLRDTRISKTPGIPSESIERTIVVCEQCGASLLQIRGGS